MSGKPETGAEINRRAGNERAPKATLNIEEHQAREKIKLHGKSQGVHPAKKRYEEDNFKKYFIQL